MYPDVSGKPMSIQDSYIRIPAVLIDDANGYFLAVLRLYLQNFW